MSHTKGVSTAARSGRQEACSEERRTVAQPPALSTPSARRQMRVLPAPSGGVLRTAGVNMKPRSVAHERIHIKPHAVHEGFTSQYYLLI